MFKYCSDHQTGFSTVLTCNICEKETHLLSYAKSQAQTYSYLNNTGLATELPQRSEYQSLNDPVMSYVRRLPTKTFQTQISLWSSLSEISDVFFYNMFKILLKYLLRLILNNCLFNKFEIHSRIGQLWSFFTLNVYWYLWYPFRFCYSFTNSLSLVISLQVRKLNVRDSNRKLNKEVIQVNCW